MQVQSQGTVPPGRIVYRALLFIADWLVCRCWWGW